MSIDQKTTFLPLGGMNPSGDPDMMPDGATRLMVNRVFRPGRTEKRPAIVNMEVSSVRGFANWLDSASGKERLVVAVSSGTTVDLRLQSATAETLAAAVTGPTNDGYMSDFCNYRSLVYYCVTNGIGPDAVPAGTHSFDGTTIKQYPFGGETLKALVVKPYGDRVFLWNVWATVTNQLGATNAYDGTGWTATSATATNITSSSAVTSRLTPTATSGAKLSKKDVYIIAASDKDTTLIFRSDLRNTSPTYALPMTLDIYYSQAWATGTAYSVNDVRVPTDANSNGFRYRVTVAGTSHAATEPTWPTTLNATVVDNGVTWICDGADTIGTALHSTLPTLSESPKFLPYFVRAIVPPTPVAVKVGVRIKFGTPSQPTITLTAVDISFKDGVTDGDLNKKNFGQQLTVGKFVYPFFNLQSSNTATIALDNDGYWTETSDPSQLLGNNYFRLSDLPGKVTAAAIVGTRLVVFKRRGMWLFQLGDDPNNPLIRERFFSNFGCIGPRALWVFEDTLYFVGENEVYRWKPGGEPEAIGGDAMREEIMTRGGWLEDLGVDPVNLSKIIGVTVDEENRDLYIATQLRTMHVMDIDGRGWSRITASAPSYAAQLTCPIWNSNRRHVYLAEDGQYAARFDDSVTADSLHVAGASCDDILITRPLPREETALDHVYVHHQTSVLQAEDDDGGASTLTVSVSLDSGATWNVATATTITVPRIAAAGAKLRIRIPLRATAPGMMIKFEHKGRASSGAFTLTGVEPAVRPKGPERTRANP